MKQVIMLIGVPGSGKSTWATRYAASHHDENVRIFSSDMYRLFLYNDENDQTHNKEVFAAMYEDVRKAYSEKEVTIILDATNLSYKDRTKTRNSLRGIHINKCVVIATPPETCVQRDIHRVRTVGEAVIKRCICKFEMPYPDEFDEIEVVGMDSYEGVHDIAYKMDTFEQHNPHHKYTVGFHCMAVAEQFHEGTPQYIAGLWHDVGKLFTQSFDENGVGHYYQHANYSAYFMLAHRKLLGTTIDFNTMLEILFYINQHMHIRDILKSPKAVKKYKALWGEERFNNLVAFNKADNAGSGTESDYESIKKGNI